MVKIITHWDSSEHWFWRLEDQDLDRIWLFSKLDSSLACLYSNIRHTFCGRQILHASYFSKLSIPFELQTKNVSSDIIETNSFKMNKFFRWLKKFKDMVIAHWIISYMFQKLMHVQWYLHYCSISSRITFILNAKTFIIITY